MMRAGMLLTLFLAALFATACAPNQGDQDPTLLSCTGVGSFYCGFLCKDGSGDRTCVDSVASLDSPDDLCKKKGEDFCGKDDYHEQCNRYSSDDFSDGSGQGEGNTPCCSNDYPEDSRLKVKCSDL